jgi:hypothetical protein
MIRLIRRSLWCLAAAWQRRPRTSRSLEHVGEVVSAGKDAVPMSGRRQSGARRVEPAIVPLAVGKQVCLSTLQMRAFGPRVVRSRVCR